MIWGSHDFGHQQKLSNEAHHSFSVQATKKTP